MRSSVDLPQPDGPEDGDEVVVARRRDRSAPARASARRRARPAERCARRCSIASLLIARLQGNSQRLVALNRKSEIEADHADDDDAEDDLAGGEQRLAVDDHVADAGRRADQLGDDDVGPGPAEHEPQDLGDLGRGGRDQHARDDAPVARAQRVGGLDQIAARAADADRHHQDDLEHRADEDDEQLLQSRRCRPTGSAAG